MKSFNVITYGCQMNKNDSEKVKSVMKSIGFDEVFGEKTKADIFILNTCSVRQMSEDRVIGRIRQIKKLYPECKVVLTGCMVKHGEKKLKSKAPGLDIVVGIEDINNLPKLLGFDNEQLEEYFEIIPDYDSKFQAFVTIMNGCNNFCTFCIVPYTRGREHSRPMKNILSEVEELLKKGYKEITLLGQNVNSYKCPEIQGEAKVHRFGKYMTLEQPGDFADLVDSIRKLGEKNPEYDAWIRFTSPHPKNFPSRLIDMISEDCEKTRGVRLTPQIHLPLQAGNNEILKKMNRLYTVEEYLELVDILRQKIPNLYLSTDVIVGFCNEDEKAFEQTCEVFREVEFDQAYIAQYSSRDFTMAKKILVDDVSIAEKKRRWDMLQEIFVSLVKKINLDFYKEGSGIQILIEYKKDDLFYGRDSRGVLCSLPFGDDRNIGDMILAKIVKADTWLITCK